jgi:[ribosomal protein S5]-alanine N-acetyltransferase
MPDFREGAVLMNNDKLIWIGAATQLYVRWTRSISRQRMGFPRMIDRHMILTNRLKLISLTTECLRAFLNGEYLQAGNAGGFKVTSDCQLLTHSSMQRRLDMIERDPEQHPWMYRAIVRKDDNVMVGHVSFHHKAPDPDLMEYSENAAELGYAIELRYRRNGYAKESALGMMNWAVSQKVYTFVLSISPENIPSTEMAKSMGFKKISERIDETDGLEYVYMLRGANI